MRFLWLTFACSIGCGGAQAAPRPVARSSDAYEGSPGHPGYQAPNPAATSTSPVAPPPSAPIVITQIAAGNNATCARLADATVQCWGDNAFNVVSPVVVGAMEEHGFPLPTSIAELPRAAKVVVGEDHACALLEDATVRCWGTDDGALGTGSPLPPGPPPSTERPMPVINLRGVVDLVGDRHLCALLADGSATCWNDYDRGFGDPRDAGSRLPVAVPGFAHAVQIADGGDLACARFASGKVRCWRDVSPGLIPRGKVRANPVDIPGITDATFIAAGSGGACAVTKAKTVRCWGQVPFEYPSGMMIRTPVAYPIAGLTDVVALALDSDTACAIVGSGDVWCDEADYSNPHRPTKVSGVAGAVEIVLGEDHACARTTAGSVLCWGDNAHGQLGDGTKTTRAEAAPVIFSKR